MYKFLLINLLIICFNITTHSQPITSVKDTPGTYEYYIRISGAITKQDVINLQNHIAKKGGVTFFMANRFPVRYFLMRTNRMITVVEFKSWMINPSWGIEFYGMGSKAKEQATMLYNKTQTSQ